MRVVSGGSIFDSSCDYLTNTVNTVGAMGAGLALEFRLRVPEMYLAYKEKCDRGEIRIGEYWIYDKPNRLRKKILNFPVKNGFNHPSKWEYIMKGLAYFKEHYAADGISSIAMPTLGSRLGKLDNEGVLMMMQEDLQRLPITIEVYRGYGQDQLAKWVKERISKMSTSEISRELGMTAPEGEKVRNRLSHSTLLSDLVVFDKMSVRLVQKLYDFGFEKTTTLRMPSFAQATGP